MFDPRTFFQNMLSPFIFMALLEFTMEGGEKTKQGADFLNLFFNNLFLCDPQDAVVETLETNFGFSVFNQKLSH